MRCKNCGWPNKPNEKVCVKCHTPLEAENDTVLESGNTYDSGRRSEAPLNKTVMETDVFGGSPHGSQGGNSPVTSYNKDTQSEKTDTQPCPKCGYPVRIGSEKCPNCNFAISQNASTPPRSVGNNGKYENDSFTETHRPTRMNNDSGKSPLKRGTVNPYTMNLEIEPSFVLKPLRRMNERHDLEEQEYEGKEVVLNRDNTEQGNPSITSRQQAVVSRVDGHWFIEDKSEQKTTFVQAARKVELHDGDLILLGNRLFVFHE